MSKRANPELVKYIEKHLSKGFKIRNVKQKLAEVGHPIEAIEDAVESVIQTKTHTKRKPKTFMIVYGIILMVVIAAFIGFIWFKAGQHVEYKEAVKEAEKEQSSADMTDVELLKFAASTVNLEGCKFIENHNILFACSEKYWERDDCIYEAILGEEVDECRVKLAVSEEVYNKYCEGILTEDGCRTTIALIEKNVSMCTDDMCVQHLAIQEKDKSICSHVYSEKSKKECLFAFAIETGSKDVCAELGQDRELCEQQLWADEDRKEHIISEVNAFKKKFSSRTATKDDLDALRRTFSRFYVEGVCEELTGDVQGYPMGELCIFNSIVGTLLDIPELEGIPDHIQELEQDEFNRHYDDTIGACDLLSDGELNWCCLNTQDEGFINRCSFFISEDNP